MANNHAIEKPNANIAWRRVRTTSSPEFEELVKIEGYHALDIEDCRHKRQLAKIIERPEYLFIIAKVAHYDPKNAGVSFSDLDIFLKSGSVVTVEEMPSAAMERLCLQLQDQTGAFVDPGYLVYRIVDEIVDDYLLALDSIGETVNNLETHVWKNPTANSLHKLFHAKRALIEFRRNAAAMREVVSFILHTPQIMAKGDLTSYWRDVYEHVVRVIEFIETYRDLLSGALDIYLTAMANRTNEVVKVLTIYGTITLPLIMITGMYGMNVGLPFQTSPHAFSVILTVSLAFTAVMLGWFKIKKWF
jgi:magnesium transporter